MFESKSEVMSLLKYDQMTSRPRSGGKKGEGRMNKEKRQQEAPEEEEEDKKIPSLKGHVLLITL